MIGYEVLTDQGSYCAAATILTVGIGFIISTLSMYYHGMGGFANGEDWGNMPILKWEKKAGEWVQVLSYGKYADYQMDDQYSYKWLNIQQEMGFVQDNPPAECHVFCSDGMRERVDEIILTLPKETYN